MTDEMSSYASQMITPIRVAIIGASGIGKNHAAWFAKNGAEVCAFAGSSEQSVATTRQVLSERLGFSVRGFSNVASMLQSEKPDAVCIASPPPRHFEHAVLCLKNGAHVLCEKPLVYDPLLTTAKMLNQADELVTIAREKNLLLGTQMQYTPLAAQLCELAGVPIEEVQTFRAEMETKNLKAGSSPETVWTELAPHPLSILQKISSDGRIETDTIQCEIRALETVAHFCIQRECGDDIAAHIVVRGDPDAITPLRRFTINGKSIDYAGRKNEAGEFSTFLSREDCIHEMPDLVDLLTGNFLRACRGEEKLQVSGEDGARNVGWMMQILERGRTP